MPRKPSEKNRAWEKERRERLNKSFEQLAKLLPQYDPSISWTKIEIIQKSVDHIEGLHQKHVEYLKSCDPEILKQHNELIDALKHYQSRNGQLADLLVKAKISLPTFKLPKFLADNPELSDENRVGDINVKSVGRPGKYANKISKDDAEKIGKQQTELSDANTTSTKPADAATKEFSENAPKELEKVRDETDAPVTEPLADGAAEDTSIKTAVLVPVISLQPQQTLNPPVITSQPAPPSGLPVPPLVNVTNLNSAHKVPKTATATHIFNYAREKNGKIKILPQPQIKLYFRRADGKIPIPVLKKRVIPTKRKRKCKRKAKASSAGSKRKKTEADVSENCKHVCPEQEKDEPDTKTDEQIMKPCENRLEEEHTKNKENMPLSSNKEESDYIATLDIPQNESNPNSVSPTAAFLMSFPVVNTSTGKLPEMMEDGEILTPNIERKDSGVDNLENLNHFFTTKEYTKFCAENSEKNEDGGKEAKPVFTLPEVATEEPKSKNMFEYFNTAVQETSNCNQNVPNATKTAENSSQIDQKHLPDTLASSRLLFSSSGADSGYTFPKQTSNITSTPPQISSSTSIPNPSISVQSFANSSSPTCTASPMPLFSTFAPTSKPFFATTTHSSYLSSQLHLATAASTCANSTTNSSSFLSSQLHLPAPTASCVSTSSTSTSFLSSRLHLPPANSTNIPSSTTQSLAWSSPNIFVTNSSTISTSITGTQSGLTNVVSNYSFWPNTFTSPTLAKNPTPVSLSQSDTQNLFGPTTTSYNSFSTSLTPRCTPLPLESSVKSIHKSQPTPTTSTAPCKPFSRKNNLPASKPAVPLLPFLESEIPCLQTTMAMDTTFSHTLTTNTVSTSPAVSKSSFPPIMSTSSAGYSNPTFTPIHNNQKDTSSYASSCLPPFRSDTSHINSSSSMPLTMNTSMQGTVANLLSSYTQSIAQSLPSSTYTPITQNSVSTRNYYYPQTPSNFNLGLTTPTTISSQLPAPQTVLPYPSLPYPSVTADYKPSFTFSLTPSTTTYCKQSEAAHPIMPPPAKCSTLPNIPYVARENEFSQKPVFNPFESPPSYKPPNLSVTKTPNNSFTSTNFTFSLTNPKTTITTANEAKPATAAPKVQPQFDNFERNYKPTTPQQFLPFNQQTSSIQKNPSFTFALTKTTKTPQKSTNSFSIDATLGIGNNSPCFLESKKTTNGTIHPTSDTNIHQNRNKPSKSVTDEGATEQMNNFYSYNQRTEKFVQKSHINWMTSSEGLPNSTDFVQSSSSRMLPESYHPFTTGEDNYPSWSPNKMYDSSHLIPPSTTVSNFYGDIGYNAPTYSLAPAAVDTQKADKTFKTSTGTSNQANFFSVSQLVDQTPSKQYDGYQKKTMPGKSKDHRKQTCLPNPSQTLYSEGASFAAGHPKPSVSNSYSAEALISKKEKHRNFGGVTSSEPFAMDTTGPIYNHTEPAEQSYNSNYFYNYPANQNYVQDTDYLGAYSTDVQFGKPINKHSKKLPPPAPPPPPPNLISYDSNYFPVPLAVNSPLMGSQHPVVDGYDPLHYNHSGNFQANSWGAKAPGIGGYHQSQPFPTSDLVQMNSDNAQSTSQSAAPGNLTNFNMSTICPEINDKVVTPNVW